MEEWLVDFFTGETANFSLTYFFSPQSHRDKEKMQIGNSEHLGSFLAGESLNHRRGAEGSLRSLRGSIER
jgi:hypothetical protein